MLALAAAASLHGGYNVIVWAASDAAAGAPGRLIVLLFLAGVVALAYGRFGFAPPRRTGTTGHLPASPSPSSPDLAGAAGDGSPGGGVPAPPTLISLRS